jgi:hypothetical protein
MPVATRFRMSIRADRAVVARVADPNENSQPVSGIAGKTLI